MECEAELASGRLAEAKGKVSELESGVGSGESAKDQLVSAKAAVKRLSEAAAAAMAKRERRTGNRRSKPTPSATTAETWRRGKSDLDRAEEKLAELKAQKH
jgi:hypothetical protein